MGRMEGDLLRPWEPQNKAEQGEKNNGPTTVSGKEKRNRTSFTARQFVYLENEFKASCYLTRLRRIHIAQALDLSEHKVKVWFQNRRVKLKKESSKNSETTCIHHRASSPSNANTVASNNLPSVGGETCSQNNFEQNLEEYDGKENGRTTDDEKKEINSKPLESSQFVYLEREFKADSSLSRLRRYHIAQKLGLSEETVEIWYKNHTMKLKEELLKNSQSFCPYHSAPFVNANAVAHNSANVGAIKGDCQHHYILID